MECLPARREEKVFVSAWSAMEAHAESEEEEEEEEEEE